MNFVETHFIFLSINCIRARSQEGKVLKKHFLWFCAVCVHLLSCWAPFMFPPSISVLCTIDGIMHLLSGCRCSWLCIYVCLVSLIWSFRSSFLWCHAFYAMLLTVCDRHALHLEQTEAYKACGFKHNRNKRLLRDTPSSPAFYLPLLHLLTGNSNNFSVCFLCSFSTSTPFTLWWR